MIFQCRWVKVVVLVFTAVYTLFAATYTVSQDGRGQYTSVQDAVSAAQSGDEVVILDLSTYEEQVTIDFAYASVVSIKDIKKGEMFTKDNLWVKRPGTGEILADEYESILGKEAKNDIPNDSLLKREDVE